MENFNLKGYLEENKLLNEETSSLVYVVIPFYSDGVSINENDVMVFKNYNDADNYVNGLEGSPIVIETELKSNMEVYMNNYQFNSFPGVHYISTGMNYFNLDITDKSMPNNIKDYIYNREIEIKKFNKICKQKNTLFNYLKYNIHNK